MRRIESNWRHKTLENLEKDFWDSPDQASRLVTRCYELRKIQLDQFTTEDLRIMIGQEIGLDFLIPLALETLSTDLFIQGNLFPGDLLKNVLAINTNFWDNNKNYWTALYDLTKNRQKEILERKFDITNFDKCKHITSK